VNLRVAPFSRTVPSPAISACSVLEELARTLLASTSALFRAI
jgi:hypothetical protein